MILAIIQRYEKIEQKKFFGERFFLTKYFKDIFEELNILLFPVISSLQLETVANICDGLIIAGRRRDIDPKYYGEEALKETNLASAYDREDELDFEAIKAFHKKGKPILGICAGLQAINVYFGGSLHQSVPEHADEDIRIMHPVIIEEDSFLYECYQSKKIEVNSFHNQAVKRLADGFKVTAVSLDGVVEAIEHENILGIQWHPEEMYDLEFFKKYIDMYYGKSI